MSRRRGLSASLGGGGLGEIGGARRRAAGLPVLGGKGGKRLPRLEKWHEFAAEAVQRLVRLVLTARKNEVVDQVLVVAAEHG